MKTPTGKNLRPVPDYPGYFTTRCSEVWSNLNSTCSTDGPRAAMERRRKGEAHESPSQSISLASETTGMDRNRTDWERCSHPPRVLKTRAGTSRANIPNVGSVLQPKSAGSHSAWRE